MKVICISCGHSLPLDKTYEDFEGLIRCYVCGALMEIKMSDGKLRGLNLPASSCEPRAETEHVNEGRV
ncbi:MAG: hypothetical protein RDU20_05455 [Desulfomonilaceae bacterium]|nr:hypothetical protein [Desulfomonilaceae bacterium]